MRRAVVADAAALALVHVRTWQTAYQGLFPSEFLGSMQVESRVRWWERFIEGGAEVHVSEADREVIGFCSVGSADDDGWGEVFAIYVHPDHWGEAHGHRLLGAAESSLRDAGFERALLWVLEANVRGRDFYERQGWKRGKPIRIEEIGGVQVTEVRYETDL